MGNVYNVDNRFLCMFPLFPALILLLLQGASNIERFPVDGRLPAALEAFHRQSVQRGSAQLSEQQEQVLASLIASGSELSQALLTFLWTDNEKPLKRETPPEVSPRPRISHANSPPPQAGFAESQRARDGPQTTGAVC